jgi:hypothetical protein
MFAPPWVALWKTTGALRIQKSSQILLGRTSEPGGAFFASRHRFFCVAAHPL